ncbi:hypothetical protein lerEdw1_014419 [Lerista edwardsae]|nr:hypothetical protein lerEdw1_014419 [Lerista edwardsae]
MEASMESTAPGQAAPAARPRGSRSSLAVAETAPSIRSIAGVYLEASRKTLPLLRAAQEHLLHPDLALALLEAQAATGGIVDPAGEQLVSVAEALRRGLAGLEMQQRLRSAEQAVTGFPDPYADGKLSLGQAIRKELVGRERGLRLLEAQVATGGVFEPTTGTRVPLQEACDRGCLDEELRDILADPGNEEAKGFVDPNSDQRITYAEMLRRSIADPATGLPLLPLEISFAGLGGAVSSHELLDSGVIDAATASALQNGEVTAQDVAELDHVEQHLSGARSIAGVAVLQSHECKSLYQALAEHLLPPGTAVALLQAQAATGCLLDPVKNERLTVDGATRAGLVGPELHETLSSAERAITGYKDPYTGEKLSLFQAMQKGLVPREPGLSLLEAQLATGGIVDPRTHHRLPVEVALQRDLLDSATHALLRSPTEGVRGFFDPSAGESLSYAELLLRCVSDPDTGLCLLPLPGSQGAGGHSFIDHGTQQALRSRAVTVPCGKHQGRPVSLWRLLFSDCFTGEQRRALAQQLRSGQLSLQGLAGQVCRTVQQVTADSRVTFEGLRERVTPAQLLSSQIINKDVFERLTQGEALAEDVVHTGVVKRYLEGTGSIGGLLLADSQEKMSIYHARRRGLLRPGTALVLLEAQAATGHVIDPAANKKYSVDEALRANVIGPDVYDKLLAAEKAVTGFRDPYTGHKISLFQAMMKELIVREHAVRLLEAQIATGGIIDPVNSHRLPVEAAYQRGYFDRKMNLILSDPSDDTKGFFDPNTQENLTYLQLKERCVTEPATGLCLLPLSSRKHQLFDAPTRQALRSSWLLVRHGRFQGQKVSLWDLLNSEYVSEGKRREVLTHFRLQKTTLQQIQAMLEEELKKRAPLRFPALRGSVSAHHLMETGVIGRALFERLLDGAVSPEEVMRMEPVKKCLQGAGSIGGIVLQPSNERMSLYEAMQRGLVVPGVALPLLEAQAATGFLIDPVSSRRLGLDGAVQEGLVGPELYEKLQRAEGAVVGYPDPFTGQKISLFQAMKKGLVADKQGMQLMDAQLATGGVIDPHRGHYVPVELAQKNGYVDEDLCARLSSSSPAAKTFCTLDSRERVTYSQLLDRCQRDQATGTPLLPLSPAASPARTEEEIQQLFRETLVEEKGVSLWELLHSGYFTEEQRRDFLERCRSEAVAPHQLVPLVLGLVTEAEMKAQSQVCLQGLRGPVPAVWLLDTGILSGQEFRELVQGRTTAGEVSSWESVRKYLQGTGSIAGVFLQASQEKMGLYRAVQNSVLLPGMGAQLLEAQAATGTITDPETGQRLGVEEAVKAGLVGEELTAQLLQAERALTGYPDPYSGRPISVCQAIRKELIPASAGIPLLEAQLATGGIIDPIHHHHLPLPAAYKHGFYDEDMHRTLAEHTMDTCVFFDPNTQEGVTYQQLKDRCVPDAHTGLLLLPLSEDAAFYGDSQTKRVLKSMPICVNVGRFKGQEVSLWSLLNSEYVTSCKRRELLGTYKEETAKTLQDIIATVTRLMEETEQQGKRFAFQGLRKQVSASDLFQSQLIDKGTLDELSQGKKTVQDVTQMDSVRPYLEGCNFIAGVLVQPNHEKMSIYQAMWRGLLRPGAALVLLEAQAATGFLIDPVKNQKLSVAEAMPAGLIGGELYEKLLSAEKAVTGYTHPYTKRPISLFEAMRQDLIVQSHGIRLLEAQIATGGIIDPVHSHRIPVEVAYKRGYFDEAMNQILLDPTDDTKGFFDPNTHENLTYLQLLERCVQDPETGLYMLQIVRSGERYIYTDEATKQRLRAQLVPMQVGRYRGQRASVWELLCSPYIQEQRRRELLSQYQCGDLGLEQLCQAVTSIVQETERSAQQLKLQGPRGEVSAAQLFNAEIIDKKTLDGLQQGPGALQQLAQEDAVKRYLQGTGCIAGVRVEASGEVLTFSEAAKRGLLSPENALLLLEAQAATGFLTDPLQKRRCSVDQAVSAGLVEGDLFEQLLLAEKATTGYTDPATGNTLSLFQAMEKKVVEKAFALRLLEAQIATGGIIDPAQGHRLPAHVASRWGCLDDDTFLLLSDAECAPKGFVDPNTHERATYAQLLHRCITDKGTGMHLLPLLGKRKYLYEDEITRGIFLTSKVKVACGKYEGQTLSLWTLLTSDYVQEDLRKRLMAKYKRESSAVLEHIAHQILSLIQEKEGQRRDSWFQGLRQQVTASELLNADIISQDTMKGLEEGRLSVQDVATMNSVRRYLEGTSCIAGVLVPSKSDPSRTEKMTIYQAMWKGVLRPGTALVLLEAQAATGFVIDPLRNVKLSVDKASHSGLVGGEIRDKLLCAEKAVTGYTDPYTGQKISLFQAMKKHLIVKEHGIRLLEAQIATGGIIDPVNSHRLPVEVAYRRGYFDEELNQILLDPTDDTKGFFDPNTHENLTYMELLRRCTPDPETGLWMLQVQPQSKSNIHLEENTMQTLKSTPVRVDAGLFQGQEVSLWEVLFSTYISQNKREDLLRDFKAGKLHLLEMITIITSFIEEAQKENRNPKRNIQDYKHDEEKTTEQGNITMPGEEKWEKNLKATKMKVSQKNIQGQQVSVWEVLFSRHVSEGKREALLSQYRTGSATLEQLTAALAALLAEPSGEASEDPTGPGGDAAGKEDDRGRAEQEEREEVLKSRLVEVAAGEFHGRKVSLWDLLHSAYFPAEKQAELLQLYDSGILTIDQMETVVTAVVNKTEEEKTRQAAHAHLQPGHWEEPLRKHTLVLHAGEFRGKEISLWDLLFSQYLLEAQREELLSREELLCLYRDRNLTPEELTAVISTLLTESLVSNKESSGCGTSADIASPEQVETQKGEAEQEEREEALKSRLVEVAAGEFHGRKVSLWDLLHSAYFPEEKQAELLQLYDSGILTIDQMETVVTTVVNKTEEEVSCRHQDSTVAEEGEPPQSSHYDLLQHVLHLSNVDVTIQDFKGQKSSVWDPFFSRVVSDIRREEIPSRHGAPAAVVTESFIRSTTFTAQSGEGHREDTRSPNTFKVSQRDFLADSRRVLKSRGLRVSTDEFYDQEVSLWDLLCSQHISEEKRKELLELYKNGVLTIDQIETFVTTGVHVAEEEESEARSPAQPQPSHCDDLADVMSPDTASSKNEGDASTQRWDRKEKTLKTRMVEVTAGEFQGRKVSLWDLLHSAYFPEEKQKELLRLYSSGILTIDQMETVVTAMVNKTEEERAGDLACVGSPGQERGARSHDVSFPRSLENVLRSESSVVQGQAVSCWDLLFSRHISGEKRQELVPKFKAKAPSVQEPRGSLTGIVAEPERPERAQSASAGGGRQEEGQSGKEEASRAHQQQLKKSLRTTMVHVDAGEFRGQKVCVLDLLFSRYVPQDKRQELLELYRAGTLPIQEMIAVITAMIGEAESQCGKGSARRKKASQKGCLCWKEQSPHS